VLLENLTPVERAVFLLREVFGYEYAEIATILDKEEAACRQLLSRAKKFIAENRPRFQPSPEKQREILTRFLEAAGAGELDGLMQLLTEDVTMWADGGGKARGAALHPLHGREAVARFVLASTRFALSGFKAELAEVNGELAAIIRNGDKIVVVLFVEVDEDRVRAVRVIGNRDKLTRV
jgi:RNA polymerase sigma-70 factor, ECF subfamily